MRVRKSKKGLSVVVIVVAVTSALPVMHQLYTSTSLCRGSKYLLNNTIIESRSSQRGQIFEIVCLSGSDSLTFSKKISQK